MPSVAILSAGLGVMVAPWHWLHVLHISTPWEDCSPVVGVLVTAIDDLYYTHHTLKQQTQGQRSHIQQLMFTEYF